MSDLAAAPRSRQATRQTWIDRLERFAASDLSVAAFCAAVRPAENSSSVGGPQMAWKYVMATPHCAIAHTASC